MECGEEWNIKSRKVYTIFILILTYILPLLLLICAYHKVVKVMGKAVQKCQNTEKDGLFTHNRNSRIKAKKRVCIHVYDCICGPPVHVTLL